MTRYVRDTKAGKSLSAMVILNKKRQEVAQVQIHYADSGNVLVNVWATGEAVKRNALAMGLMKAGEEIPSDKYDRASFQHSTAGGYGYDKAAAATRGLFVDGIELADHCGRNAETAKLLKRYHAAVKKNGDSAELRTEWNKKAEKIGAHFANWSHDLNGWTDLYLSAGLDSLRKRGYDVIQVI